MTTKLQEIVDSQGDLPTYANGGYPLYYVDQEGSTLCPDCANKSFHDFDELPQFNVVDYDVNWENDIFFCDQCSNRIPSAYGDDNE
jgi:hypothetical protein